MDPLDLALSQWLRQHSVPGFARFMDQSLFEGKALGAGDFAIFVQIVIVGLWLRDWRRRQQASLPGYILVSSILTALGVHLLKGLVARPRPYELLMPTSSWQGVTAHLFQGWGHGSFPSGHTANAISLIAVAYALHALHFKKAAWICGSLVLLFALSMGLSRIMLGAHWPTDTLAAVFLGWVVAHTRYRIWQKRTEKAL